MGSAQRITRDAAKQLLQGFVERQAAAAPMQSDGLRRFLRQFTEAQGNANRAEQSDAHSQSTFLRDMLERFGMADERWRQAEETTATVFNALEALGLPDSELLHSSALAWMLSRNNRDPGSHAQGNLGFKLFLDELSLPLEWAEQQYSVKKETQGYESRVDVEIACPCVFLIHIENKVWSAEGANQLIREHLDLQRRATFLQVPTNAARAIFLTPTGRTPSHGEFRALAWSTVARIFDRFAKHAKAPMVQLFSAHYADAVRNCIAGSNYDQEHEDGQTDV